MSFSFDTWNWLPASLATYSDSIDDLFWTISWLMGVTGIISLAIILYFMLAFKRKEGVRAQYIGGDTGKQLAFVYIILGAFVLMDLVIDVKTHAVWANVKESLPGKDVALKVRSIGQQWAWTFVHPGKDGAIGTDDDISTVNELHIPADTMVHNELESSDVLHSFSVPIFRIKQDVIPGRIITTWFQTKSFSTVKDAKNSMNTAMKDGGALLGADEDGYASFDLQCTEMCGVGHGIMSAKIFIHSAEDYGNWVNANSPVSESAE